MEEFESVGSDKQSFNLEWPNHSKLLPQWDPSIIMVTIGTKDFGHYRGVATNRGVYKVLFQWNGDHGEWPL